ncbi:MAG: CYTH domain-containing protein [Alphaproteobacteria bacterium]|nr:CYTH domain-containing protein [Alphaproteobacteria bacterium]
MKHQIECEEKFFCKHTPELISFILNELNFKFKETLEEEDIYLKDEKGIYIKKDACLRLRKTNNLFLELTRKSVVNQNNQLKKEKNIPFPINKEKRLLSLLKRIGISPYCQVKKQRTIYLKRQENLTYSITLDTINNKTQFMELEITTKSLQNDLEIKLDNFISLFHTFNLKKANTNYRDFIINEIKS